MISQKDLCLRLCTYILITREQLSGISTVNSFFEVDILLTQIIKEYISCPPEKLEVLQAQSPKDLFIAAIVALRALANEYERRIIAIDGRFSDAVLKSVIPDYKDKFDKIRANCILIQDVHAHSNSDSVFVSAIILNGDSYLQQLNSQRLELKTIYELISKSEKKFKRKSLELGLIRSAKVIGSILTLVIAALAVWVAYLQLIK